MKFLMSSTRLEVDRLESIPKHQNCLYQSSLHQKPRLQTRSGLESSNSVTFWWGVRAENLAKPKFRISFHKRISNLECLQLHRI
jgi:hypothetical protein